MMTFREAWLIFLADCAACDAKASVPFWKVAVGVILFVAVARILLRCLLVYGEAGGFGSLW